MILTRSRRIPMRWRVSLPLFCRYQPGFYITLEGVKEIFGRLVETEGILEVG
jgi:hypothetical protein